MTSPNVSHYYLYISGMQVSQPIALHDGMTLLPASPPSALVGTLHEIRDLAQLGMVSLYLPLATAQLKIPFLHQDDIPALTNRASRILLLLGALFDRNIAMPLMGFTLMEEIRSAVDVRVAIDHLFPRPENRCNPLSPPETAWIETHIPRMNAILSGSMAFNTAAHCLATHAWHTAPRAQLALIWAGIEALFHQRKGNTPHIASLAATFLHPDTDTRRGDVETRARFLYTHRSNAVHGCELVAEAHRHVPDSAGLLRNLLFRCIESGGLPDNTQATDRR